MSCPNYILAGWTEWDEWSSCQKTCGKGQSARRRTCRDDNRHDLREKTCKGIQRESRLCDSGSCDVIEQVPSVGEDVTGLSNPSWKGHEETKKSVQESGYHGKEQETVALAPVGEANAQVHEAEEQKNNNNNEQQDIAKENENKYANENVGPSDYAADDHSRVERSEEEEGFSPEFSVEYAELSNSEEDNLKNELSLEEPTSDTSEK